MGYEGMVKKSFWLLIVICGLAVLFANIPCEQEKTPHAAESAVTINLSPDEAWKRLSDLTLAHYYVPGLINTRITTDHQQGVGASRRVYQSERRYINETVVAWQEGRAFTVNLHNDKGKGPFPFGEASFTYGISPVSAEQVRMTTSLHYRMAMGYLGHWLHDWFLAEMFQDRINKVAANLKHFYETGSAETRHPAK